MANSKLRCVSCKGYFKRELMLRDRAPALCSVACQVAYENKARVQHARHQQRSARRKSAPSMDDRIRRRIRRRDHNRCRWCGRTDALEVHHIAYRSQGGPDADWNLITLCEEHHRQVHANKHRWQPVLYGVIWMHYVRGRPLTVPQFVRWADKRELLASSGSRPG